MIDFAASDEFSLVNLTEAMNTIPVAPNRIGSMNLFRGGGIRTTSVAIEQRDHEFKLIPTQPRGTIPEAKTTPVRNLRTIAVPHLPKMDYIAADDIQDLRAFGSETELEQLSTVVNDRLAMLKAEHETTWEYHRIGALQGKILDADGTTVVVNFFTEYGVSRIVVNWDKTNSNGLKAACISLRRNIQRELKNHVFNAIHVMCGEQMWEDIITSSEVKDAYNRWNENQMGRESNDQPFVYSKVRFEELMGSVAGNAFIPTAEGAAFPIVPQSQRLYRNVWAPAPFNETVNTVGRPYYAKQKPDKFETGVELYTNSNPLMHVTKPRTLIQLTQSG